ncbi:MAG: hypothetical protein KGZ83_10395 [Sulfuricella sp.]|nr:hypothetical protein [Sulfuricella sp.]
MIFARKLKRKFSIASSPLAVRRQLAWYWRIPLVLLLMIGGLGLAWWTYDAGMRFAGFERGATSDELRELRDKVSVMERENVSMRSQVAQNERRMQIEQATQADLARSVKVLEDENAHLKEDIAFFRKLMSADKNDGGLSVYRLKVENNVLPGEYRYQLLLLQGGQREREFQGKVQLLVNLQLDGKKMFLTLPSANGKDAQTYNLNFKFYQRLEGTFQIMPRAQIKNIQVRVFENGSQQPKLMQTVNIS